MELQHDPWHVSSLWVLQKGEAPCEHPTELIQSSQDGRGAGYEAVGPPSSNCSAATSPQALKV